MKVISIILLMAICCNNLLAQVGIGTTTPNTKAVLDLSSTNRGLLLPRMTTSQRLNITAPPNGLLVYDTDKNELYQYNGSSWLAVLNGDYWIRPITNRNRIANYTDSVGIGVTSPQERLDVNGNVRSRANIVADGSISAGTTLSGATLTVTGNAAVVGTSYLVGDVSTNGDITMNNAGATLQMKSSSVNKGYLQLSGDNVRIGTNSGNEEGKFIIRNNGADRIAVDADGRLTTPAAGNNSLIPLCYGSVRDGGVVYRSTDNVTVTKMGTPSSATDPAYYRITCTGISATSVICVTADSEYNTSVSARCYLAGVARVYTYEKFFDPEAGDLVTDYFHDGFSFVIYK